MRRRLRRSKHEIILRAVRPNLGQQARMRRALDRLIDKMQASYVYWIKAAYRANEPRIAQDETPAAELQKVVRQLGRQWQRRFNKAAPLLADYFATEISERSDAALRKILKDAGISVKFRMTATQRDVLRATIGEQVGLIKSIPSQYLTNVEGLVMRSVQSGRDLGTLTSDLQKQFGVTKRRAALISRDQNNKTTATLTRARQTELGITQAIWMHSGGGKTKRPTHVRMDGKRYDVRKGWYDPAVRKLIFPGELINCHCVSRSVIPGLDD